MSSDTHEHIIYGSNRIRAYVGDDLHWELVPHGFSAFGDDGTTTATVVNNDDASPTCTVRIWRMGPLRIVRLGAYAGTMHAAEATIANTSYAVIPQQDCPGTAIVRPMCVYDGGATTDALGAISISTAGAISIGVGTSVGHFQAAAGGWPSAVFIWQAASDTAVM